jgi:hypothetical protein
LYSSLNVRVKEKALDLSGNNCLSPLLFLWLYV